MVSRRQVLHAAAALTTGLTARPFLAAADETFPTRPIRVVIANPPGGTDDSISRRLAPTMSSDLRQPVVVENRAGGSTTVGGLAVARSAPDGYTLLNLTNSGIIQTVLRNNLQYGLRDFTPVVGIGGFPMVLIVSAKSDIRTVADLAAPARTAEGITFATAGVGTLAQLSSVRLMRELGGTGTHVPYRGNMEGIQGVAGGFTHMMFPSILEAAPLRNEGLIRILAVTSEQRAVNLPDVPTMAELGFPSINPRLSYVYMAPAGTPAPVVARLAASITKAVRDASFQDSFGPLGFQTDIRTGEALSTALSTEAERWRSVIRDNNISVTD